MATLEAPPGSAQALADNIVMQDAAKGNAPVHSFDPESSPQEKASAAGKARDKLKPTNDQTAGGERGIAVDPGNLNIQPTVNVHDVDGNIKQVSNGGPVQPAQSKDAEPPGAMPDGSAPPIPDWYKVGWRAASGIDAPPLQEGEEKDRSVLGVFLAEQFYGEWYHNAALIFVVVLVSHFMTRFHAGFGWLFILLAFANTYFSTSMERFRRRARDDIQRELVKTSLASEHETANWINHFLERFWLIYEPILSQTIVSTVDQVLSVNTPPFLDSLRLSTFTLGTKAPKIDKVRTFPKTEDDVVMMDWGLSFTPNDISDMTKKQAEMKVNPKIVLSVRVGKGIAGASIPILVEDITFTGLMRIRLKLMTNFPHIQLVQMSFLEPPFIDFVLKPIGGDTFGLDINHIPGLSSFIRSLTHASLGPMLYDPNSFTLNLEQLLSGAPLDAAIGVLQVTVQSARGIKGAKIGGGTPDPFVALSINNRADLAKTKYKHSTNNPHWGEAKFILLNNITESLVLNIYDFNEHTKNTLLGSATFDLTVLARDATREGIEQPILRDGKSRGDLRFDVSYYPVLKQLPGQGKEILEQTSTGIVRLTIHQAKELDVSKSLSGDLNPFAKVYTGGKKSIHTTSRFKHTNNPVWESATEFLCLDRASSIVTVMVVDDRDFLKDPVLGYLSIKLEDLLIAMKEAGRDWWPLSNCKSGRVRLSVEWKPLNMAGTLQGVNRYVPPIGVVRLHLEKAMDLKNVEVTLGGKSDPYVRVMVNGVTKGRTEVISNNLNPVWNQRLYIPVHSLKEVMVVECLDCQSLTKDRSLGSIELKMTDLAKMPSTSGNQPESTGPRVSVDMLDLGNGVYKGKLHYTAEFIPSLPTKFVKFESPPNEAQQVAGDDDEGSSADDRSIVSRFEFLEGMALELVGSKASQREQRKSTDSKASISPTNETNMPSATSEKGTVSPTNGKGAVTASSDTHSSNGKTPDSNSVHEDAEPKETEAKQLSNEELLSYQSGIIIFNVSSGSLHSKARLQVSLDDGYWPAFSTVRARSTQARWDHVGEGFIKELEFSKVFLRLNSEESEEREYIIAEWRGDTKTFLEDTLGAVKSITLVSSDKKESTVEIETRYVPVPIQLGVEESVKDQGLLYVELLDAHDLAPADRGGKSDPYAVFSLNGQRVFKSQTKKKTLNPEWNENFEVRVLSRTAAEFSVEVFDWNQVEQAKSLGVARIELNALEPFQDADLQLVLRSPKFGEKGKLRIRVNFRSEYLVKSKKPTQMTFSASKTMTQISSLPMGAGKGVLQGVTSVFKKDRDPAKPIASSDGSVILEPPAELVPQPVGQLDPLVANSVGFPSQNSDNGSNEENKPVRGTLKLTVLEAENLAHHDVKPYVTVRLGDKEVKTKPAGKVEKPEWNETFVFTVGALTPKAFLWVHDHRTLAKDKLLGEGEVDIWRHLQSHVECSADVSAELRQSQGLVRLHLEFHPEANASTLAPSPSFDRNSIIGGTMKFGIRGRKSLDAGKG